MSLGFRIGRDIVLLVFFLVALRVRAAIPRAAPMIRLSITIAGLGKLAHTNSGQIKDFPIPVPDKKTSSSCYKDLYEIPYLLSKIKISGKQHDMIYRAGNMFFYARGQNIMRIDFLSQRLT